MIKSLTVLILVALIFCFSGCGDDAVVNNVNQVTTIRSADPLQRWQDWSEGQDALVTPQLRDGNASHNLSPAELIYYCAHENNINPVLLMVLLENQQLLTADQTVGDFELRLYNACNYDIGSGKYGGFFPQMVASTFQMWLDQENGLTFRQSYDNNFDSVYSVEEFLVTYDEIAGGINNMTGLDCNTSPDPDSADMFGDYPDLSIEQIQSFLNQSPNSALKRNLFQEAPVSNSVQY